MSDNRQTFLKENFLYFQSVVGRYMADHAGEYALLYQREVVDVFKRPIEALEAGNQKFADGLFSIQKVTDRPLDLGFMSYGASDRAADRR